MSYTKIVGLLCTEAESLLKHQSKTFSKSLIQVPGLDFIDRISLKFILVRKAFQRPVEEGIKLLNNVQDVYLAKEIDLA